MVSCSAQDHRAGLYLSEPKLIDATAAFDRGGKFAAYRSLPSLQEYVIVHIADRRVECFRRTADNGWLLQDYIGEQVCQFTSIGVSMALVEVFEDVWWLKAGMLWGSQSNGAIPKSRLSGIR